MTLGKDGFASRLSRVTKEIGGASATSSQDFMLLAKSLYRHSAEYASSCDGNCSIYAVAGIPALFSAVRCLLIELHAQYIDLGVPDEAALRRLTEASNDVAFIVGRYPGLSPALAADLRLLWQVRNEIAHPAHRPGPERDGTPTYLDALRVRGLLQSTGQEADFVWIAQLQSHRLLTWAFVTIEQTVAVALTDHGVDHAVADAVLWSYSEYRRAAA